ncbi:MAG: hypothetical protein HY016_08850 [Nitrosomonadales bacterium]|nr:hypothetical protein [Nitrosomonadales bacterium]
MSEYQSKLAVVAGLLDEFRAAYLTSSAARAATGQARVVAEIEIITRLNLSREQLIGECALRKVEQDLTVEKFADYKRIVELIQTALDAAAPLSDTFSDTQSAHAQKSRGKLENAETVADIMGRLAGRKDELGDFERPADLWPHLFSELSDAGCTPKERRNNSEPRKSAYTYTRANGKTARIQRSTFATKIGKLRKLSQ